MADSAHPGWYQAQGDPPGTERYWDGSAWTQGPRPIVEASGTPPVPPVAPANPTASLPTDMGSTEPSSGMPTMPSSGMPTMPSTEPSSGMPTMGSTEPSSGMPTMPSFGGESAGAAPSGGAVGNPLPVAGQAPPPGQAPPGFPGAPPSAPAASFPGAVATYPEGSKGVLALVLSIIGFFIPLLGPPGLILGFLEKKAIDDGRRDPKNRGVAIAAIVIGILTTLWLLFFVLILVVAIAASA